MIFTYSDNIDVSVANGPLSQINLYCTSKCSKIRLLFVVERHPNYCRAIRVARVGGGAEGVAGDTGPSSPPGLEY